MVDISVPILWNMQPLATLTGEVDLTMNLPHGNAQLTVQINATSDIGEIGVVTLSVLNLGSNSTTPVIAMPWFLRRTSPSEILGSIQALLQAPTAMLLGQLHAALPMLQTTLADISPFAAFIGALQPYMSFPAWDDPVLLTSDVMCLDSVQGSDAPQLNITVNNGDVVVSCVLSSVPGAAGGSQNLSLIADTAAADLARCGLSEFLTVSLVANVVKTDGTFDPSCGQLGLYETTPGLVQTLVVNPNNAPGSCNLTWSGSYSARSLPIFGSFSDAVASLHEVFQASTYLPRNSSTTVPASAVSGLMVDPVLTSFYRQQLPAILIPLELSYGDPNLTATALFSNTINILGGRLSIDVDRNNSNASGTVFTKISTSAGVVFDCPGTAPIISATTSASNSTAINTTLPGNVSCVTTPDSNFTFVIEYEMRRSPNDTQELSVSRNVSFPAGLSLYDALMNRFIPQLSESFPPEVMQLISVWLRPERVIGNMVQPSQILINVTRTVIDDVLYTPISVSIQNSIMPCVSNGTRANSFTRFVVQGLHLTAEAEVGATATELEILWNVIDITAQRLSASARALADVQLGNSNMYYTVNSVLGGLQGSNATTFYGMFQAGVSFDVQVSIDGLEAQVVDMEIGNASLSLGANASLTMLNSVTGFADVVAGLNWHANLSGQWGPSMDRILQSNLSLCAWMEMLDPALTALSQSPVAQAHLPFVSRSAQSLIQSYLGQSVLQLINNTCEKNETMSLAVFCALVYARFGSKLCAGKIDNNVLTMQLNVTSLNNTSHDNFEVSLGDRLPLGLGAGGDINIKTHLNAVLELVADFSDGVMPDITLGPNTQISAGVSFLMHGSMQMWIGPMRIPLGNMVISLGAPEVAVLVAFGPQGQLASFTAEGSAKFQTNLPVDEYSTCAITITVPDVFAFLTNGSAAQYLVPDNRCGDDLEGILLEMLERHIPLHYFEDSSRFISDFESGITAFMDGQLFGPEGFGENLVLPLLKDLLADMITTEIMNILEPRVKNSLAREIADMTTDFLLRGDINTTELIILFTENILCPALSPVMKTPPGCPKPEFSSEDHDNASISWDFKLGRRYSRVVPSVSMREKEKKSRR